MTCIYEEGLCAGIGGEELIGFKAICIYHVSLHLRGCVPRNCWEVGGAVCLMYVGRDCNPGNFGEGLCASPVFQQPFTKRC